MVQGHAVEDLEEDLSWQGADHMQEAIIPPIVDREGAFPEEEQQQPIQDILPIRGPLVMEEPLVPIMEVVEAAEGFMEEVEVVIMGEEEEEAVM